MTIAYWNVVKASTPHSWSSMPSPTVYEIMGAAGEVVVFSTKRLVPMDELNAMTKALNDLPTYRRA